MIFLERNSYFFSHIVFLLLFSAPCFQGQGWIHLQLTGDFIAQIPKGSTLHILIVSIFSLGHLLWPNLPAFFTDMCRKSPQSCPLWRFRGKSLVTWNKDEMASCGKKRSLSAISLISLVFFFFPCSWRHTELLSFFLMLLSSILCRLDGSLMGFKMGCVNQQIPGVHVYL